MTFNFSQHSAFVCISLDISYPTDTFDIDLSSRAVESETADQREAASSAVSLQPTDSSDLSDEEDFEFITTEDL